MEGFEIFKQRIDQPVPELLARDPARNEFDLGQSELEGGRFRSALVSCNLLFLRSVATKIISWTCSCSLVSFAFLDNSARG